MKKFKLFALAIVAIGLGACNPQNEPEQAETFTLDLTALPETFTFEANSAWEQTYMGDVAPFTIGEFTFNHYGHTPLPDSEGDYATWEGFTVCNSQNTAYNDDFFNEQWNIVAGGGKAGLGAPYVLAYCANYNVQNDIFFTTERLPKEIYFCQSAWTANCIEGKDGYARAFEKGDYLTVTVKGLDADGNEIAGKEVVYYLADYQSDAGSQFMNTNWERCDLSDLGACHGLRFVFFSTDKSDWGFNTAQYFAIDGLQVESVK